MLQSGELMNAYRILIVYAEEALRDFEQIRQDAVTAPGIDVSRQAARAKDKLESVVIRAKALAER